MSEPEKNIENLVPSFFGTQAQAAIETWQSEEETHSILSKFNYIEPKLSNSTLKLMKKDTDNVMKTKKNNKNAKITRKKIEKIGSITNKMKKKYLNFEGYINNQLGDESSNIRLYGEEDWGEVLSNLKDGLNNQYGKTKIKRKLDGIFKEYHTQDIDDDKEEEIWEKSKSLPSTFTKDDVKLLHNFNDENEEEEGKSCYIEEEEKISQKQLVTLSQVINDHNVYINEIEVIEDTCEEDEEAITLENIKIMKAVEAEGEVEPKEDLIINEPLSLGSSFSLFFNDNDSKRFESIEGQEQEQPEKDGFIGTQLEPIELQSLDSNEEKAQDESITEIKAFENNTSTENGQIIYEIVTSSPISESNGDVENVFEIANSSSDGEDKKIEIKSVKSTKSKKPTGEDFFEISNPSSDHIEIISKFKSSPIKVNDICSTPKKKIQVPSSQPKTPQKSPTKLTIGNNIKSKFNNSQLNVSSDNESDNLPFLTAPSQFFEPHRKFTQSKTLNSIPDNLEDEYSGVEEVAVLPADFFNKWTIVQLKNQLEEWSLKPVKSKNAMINLLNKTSKLINKNKLKECLINWKDGETLVMTETEFKSQVEVNKLELKNDLIAKVKDLLLTDKNFFNEMITYKPIDINRFNVVLKNKWDGFAFDTKLVGECLDSLGICFTEGYRNHDAEDDEEGEDKDEEDEEDEGEVEDEGEGEGEGDKVI